MPHLPHRRIIMSKSFSGRDAGIGKPCTCEGAHCAPPRHIDFRPDQKRSTQVLRLGVVIIHASVRALEFACLRRSTCGHDLLRNNRRAQCE